jgi:hypothetical protein
MWNHPSTLEWMPPEHTVSVVATAKWWDAVVVPQVRGLDALQVLDHEAGRAPGPVIWEPLADQPRLYFLVPVGTADAWDVPGTKAFGTACFIGVPGPTTIGPPTVHWLVPPDPDNPRALVDAGALRDALLLVAARSAA